MLSAPRYSSAVPNANGDWAVFSVDTYSFDDHEESLQWKLLRLSTGEISNLPFTDDVSEIVWVGDTATSVLYINGTNDEIRGGVTLWTADLADDPIKGYAFQAHLCVFRC